MLTKFPLLGLVRPGIVSTGQRFLSSNTAAVVKVHRSIYARRYPTMVVLPNGATININYHEPRRIIKVIAVEIQFGLMFLKNIALF